MRRIALMLMVLASAPALACSFPEMEQAFVPDLDGFKAKREADQPALLPAPDVRVLKVTRGTQAPGASCADAGVIKVRVRWPVDSVYKLEDVGFYFRVWRGQAPDHVLPRTPVVSLEREGQEQEFWFVWLDGHPRQHQPLDFQLEVFAVNRGLEIGPAALVRVSAQ